MTPSTTSLPPPDKIVYYPILDHDNNTNDPAQGRLFIHGKKSDAPHRVLFCSGFPDDHAPFQVIAARLARDAACLCGIACLPGFDNDDDDASQDNNNNNNNNNRIRTNRSEGYTFDEMTTALRHAAKALCDESTNSSASYTTIFHDWGCVVGALYTNHALFLQQQQHQQQGHEARLLSPDRIVYFDVLPTRLHRQDSIRVRRERKSWHGLLCELGYRVVLATSFAIQRFVSTYLAATYLVTSFALLTLLRLTPLHSKRDLAVIQHTRPSLSRLMYMAYPYYYLWWEVAKFGHKALREFRLPLLDTTPVLFLFGADKRIPFHDANIVGRLGQHANGYVVRVDQAGHWLFLQQPDVCIEAVKEFLQVTPAVASKKNQ